MVVRDTGFRDAVNDNKAIGIQGLHEREKRGMYFINVQSKLICITDWQNASYDGWQTVKRRGRAQTEIGCMMGRGGKQKDMKRAKGTRKRKPEVSLSYYEDG